MELDQNTSKPAAGSKRSNRVEKKRSGSRKAAIVFPSYKDVKKSGGRSVSRSRVPKTRKWWRLDLFLGLFIYAEAFRMGITGVLCCWKFRVRNIWRAGELSERKFLSSYLIGKFDTIGGQENIPRTGFNVQENYLRTPRTILTVRQTFTITMPKRLTQFYIFQTCSMSSC